MTEYEMKILKERARSLAAERKVENAEISVLDVTVFGIGEDLFAADLWDIKEVWPLSVVTPLPGAPRHILGVINARGRIVALNDLRVLLKIQHASDSRPRHGVVLSSKNMELALAADFLEGVRRIASSDVLPPPSTMDSSQKKYVRGVTRDRLVVLDSRVLLNSKKLVVDQMERE